MKQTCYLLLAVLYLSLLSGCGLGPAEATPTPQPPTVAAALPNVTPTPLPSDSPVPPATDTPPPASDTPPPPPTETPIPSPTANLAPTQTPVEPTPTLALTLSVDQIEMMDDIEEEMEDLRGLEGMQPVVRSLMTREELGAYMEREMAVDYPREEIASDTLVLAVFDFVPEDFDLERVLLDLYSTQILGMYDDEEDTFYVVSEGDLDLMDRLTFAHEFVHALQDEHYDLESFVDEDKLSDDQVLARLSLVEGDATLSMSEYLIAHISELTDEDMEALESAGDAESEEALAAAPPIIRETLDFPYLYGLDFVAALREEGWQAVDAAYADPPQSTEQILHPEKYLFRDEPTLVSLPPLTDTLGAGWHLVEAETLGEFQTGLYLENRLDKGTASLASEGWDGDQYAVYARDGGELLVFATVWDSPQDREEFVTAYGLYAEGKYGAQATRTGEGETWWETPEQTAVLAWDDTMVWVVLGPDVETVSQVLAIVRLGLA